MILSPPLLSLGVEVNSSDDVLITPIPVVPPKLSLCTEVARQTHLDYIFLLGTVLKSNLPKSCCAKSTGPEDLDEMESESIPLDWQLAPDILFVNLLSPRIREQSVELRVGLLGVLVSMKGRSNVASDLRIGPLRTLDGHVKVPAVEGALNSMEIS